MKCERCAETRNVMPVTISIGGITHATRLCEKHRRPLVALMGDGAPPQTRARPAKTPTHSVEPVD